MNRKEVNNMYERVLIPIESPHPPPRALVCFAGDTPTSSGEPILMGPMVPVGRLGAPLREYLEERARKLRSMGVKASPLLAASDGANEEILHLAEECNAAMYVVSMHGPYEVKSTNRHRRRPPVCVDQVLAQAREMVGQSAMEKAAEDGQQSLEEAACTSQTT
jgi:hypothetical protein